MRQFIIDSKAKLKQKLDMVQTLGDIEIATKLLENVKKDNDVDSNYGKLHCTILPVETNVPSP